MSFQLSRKLNWVTIFSNFSTVPQTLYDSSLCADKKVIFQQENFVSQVSQNFGHMLGVGKFLGLSLPTLRLVHCCPAGLLQPTEAGRRMEDLWPRLAASLLSPDSREADRGCRGSATAAAPSLQSSSEPGLRPERPGPASHIYAATRSASSRRHQQELEKRVRGLPEPGRAGCSVCAGPDSNSAPVF